MRVALDVRRMSDFGVATYLRNVVRTIGRVDRTNEYFLIGNADKLIEQVGELPPNFTPIPFETGDVTPRIYFEFRRVVKHIGCDLIHVPHTFWRPLPVSCPYIMTVHDLLDYMYRAKARTGVGRIVHFYLTRQVMHRAARLLAVSNFTKQDIQRFFQVSGNKIEVVYNALDEKFAQGHTTPEERQTIVERYQVNYPFVLYTGRISP